jgi:hypothetical protein
VAEVRVRAHFPAVFNYRRVGGSLEPDASDARANEAPAGLPGKVLAFRQFLVSSSAPNLELGYSVDIAQSYFK